jgi:hypothetical protein
MAVRQTPRFEQVSAFIPLVSSQAKVERQREQKSGEKNKHGKQASTR